MAIKVSKPFIEIKGKTLLEYSLNCLELSDFNVIICTRENIYPQQPIVAKLKEMFGEEITVHLLPDFTKGALETAYSALPYCDPSLPTVIHSLDIEFNKISTDELLQNMPDVRTLVFKAGSPSYSYVKTDGNFISEVAEKRVISKMANIGIYIFKDVAKMKEIFNTELNSSTPELGEYHIAPIINDYIKLGYKADCKTIHVVHVFGTPKEKQFFEEMVCKNKCFKIGFFSDHSGLLVKDQFKEVAEDIKVNYEDYGVFNDTQLASYVDVAKNMVDKIRSGEIDYAFMFCASGNGINIACNKLSSKVISSLIYDKFSFIKAIEHNNANVFSIPGRCNNFFSSEDVKFFLKNLYSLTFEGGRHSGKLMELLY